MKVVAVTIHLADQSGASHHITWSNETNKDLADLLQVIVFELDKNPLSQRERG
jgi:hypothetical protein